MSGDDESTAERDHQPSDGQAASGPAFPIVGLGASAGGLEALTEFFDQMPSDGGMAFVIVTHQATGHSGWFAESLRRHTMMPVEQVSGSVEVSPNVVYLAPAGQALVIRGRVLHASKRTTGPTSAFPIDSFFRSLAEDQKDHAIGIVLSGVGSDGALGLEDIKAASGMVMAQEESSARFAGMPHSAIGTHVVDYVTSASDLPRHLLAYARETHGPQTGGPRELTLVSSGAYDSILGLLQSRTGHDFSGYKRKTLRRRIERRMAVNHTDGAAAYLRHLESNPLESEALFGDLLIGVTSFFRDPEAFRVLETAVLPELVGDKPKDSTLRVWVPGCSTGEEAYSLAILLQEAQSAAKRRLGVQIFGTDLNPRAIDFARRGVYGEGITVDLEPTRLERHFVREGSSYRVRKEIRELVVFAQHNVFADAPFIKLDLLSCRNLLIYLDSSLQRRLIPMFHYALRPRGVLVLSAAESIGGFSNLFSAIESKWRIFRRLDQPAVASSTDPSVNALGLRRSDTPRVFVGRAPARPSGVQLAERVLLQALVPPSVIINPNGDIIHIHGRTGRYLEPAQGPQTPANVFRMARRGLQLELVTAVREARAKGQSVRPGVRVESDADHARVDLHVRRLSEPEAFRDLFVVAFEPARVPVVAGDGRGESRPPGRVTELERELHSARDMHRDTVEELESANQELRSVNEELQSTNEELQSTNEELETSTEELQSVNEELQTVNLELHGKLGQLSRVHDEMNNLLNSSDIATIFLDDDLNIKSFTERATSVIPLIPSDVGRRIGDLTSSLKYHRLVDDARDVLRTLVFKEVEVLSVAGTWYLVRILPYRTTDNLIDGLVISFVDITALKLLQRALQQLTKSLELSSTAVFAHDGDLRYVWAHGNPFGVPSEQVVGRTDAEVFSAGDADELLALKRRALETRRATRGRVRVASRGSSSDYDLLLQCLPEGSAADVILGVCAAAPGHGEPAAEEASST